MDEQVQQQIIQLVQAAMQGDQQATQYIQQIMQAAEQGDQQATLLAQMIQTVALQMQNQQVQAAKFGAKLNYIKQLKGVCPEGYEMEYFKQGGALGKRCKRCESIAKQQEGDEMNPVDSFKCGRKMKKVEKDQKGQKFKQTSKTDKYGNVTYTRTYKGYKPVSYTTAEEGEGFYSDHKGNARVEDLDSLANVYENGPRKKEKKIVKNQNPSGPIKPKQVKITWPSTKDNGSEYMEGWSSYGDGSRRALKYEHIEGPNDTYISRSITYNPLTPNDTIISIRDNSGRELLYKNGKPGFRIANDRVFKNAKLNIKK